MVRRANCSFDRLQEILTGSSGAATAGWRDQTPTISPASFTSISSARGWLDARDHPEEAIDIVLKSASGLNRALEITTLKNMGDYFTSLATKQHGWGYMDPKVWAELSDIYISLEQMPRPVKPDEIMTNELVVMAKTPKV